MGMPDWAQDHIRKQQQARAALESEPGTVSLLDLVLEVCRVTNRTDEQVLDMPISRFWRVLLYLKRRNAQKAQLAEQVAEQNPMAALSLYAGAGGGDL